MKTFSCSLREKRWSLAIALILSQWAALAQNSSNASDPWTIDFRYRPASWQTSICLPDDWQKTLVARDGGLLYDYPGPFAGFSTKITAGLASETQWQKQELLSPRVPIVRTFKKGHGVEIVEEALAVAPPVPASKGVQPALVLERVGSFSANTGWAKPPASADPAFRNIDVGYHQPLHYRFPAESNQRFTVVFGLCEGWHTNAHQRVLNLNVEGQSVRTVDMMAEKGRNVPALFPFSAHDENGDGWIDLEVTAATNSPDDNTILNVLWVFPAGDAPDLAQLLAGQSVKPPLLHLDCGADSFSGKPPRHDLLLVRLRNSGAPDSKVIPTLSVESAQAVTPQADRRHVLIGAGTTLLLPQQYERIEKIRAKTVFYFPSTNVRPDQETILPFSVARGEHADDLPRDSAQAVALRAKAVQFWEKLDLPYDHIQVPDAGVQALVDSSIRNIYQAREIKKGLPAFQVGPTCYRGLWVVDGSFIMEAIAYLDRAQEARNGIKYLLSFQRPDGSFMLIDGHWKETGIVLWAVTHHARLTGDKQWLRGVWPKVERAVGFIDKMRGMAPADAPNAGLVPDGFSDGGLAGKVPEYTNIYWTMAGLRAAIEAARWLGETATAEAWQKEYDDFYQTFRRAAQRDLRTDAHGNRYLPIRMTDNAAIPPQKAQWAFCHAVFPGQVFATNDPLVLGNMAMLRAVEDEGLVRDTGWLKDGIWNYFGSFYAHAWLWLGHGDKAARTLYSFGNHASPLLVWREEQKPVGQGPQMVGDMPHNWASAEFIRLVRHLLVLERGQELHLFEGLPAKWAQPGSLTRLRNIATEFGPMSLEFNVADDGSTATLDLTPPRRTPPTRIVLHLDHWSGQSGTMELPVTGTIHREFRLKHPGQ